MIYCINPECEQRENSAAAQNCQACGTALLIADRYRIAGKAEVRSNSCKLR